MDSSGSEKMLNLQTGFHFFSTNSTLTKYVKKHEPKHFQTVQKELSIF